MHDPNSTVVSLKYLALGDSYTIGEGVAAAARWPVRLAARLREAGIALPDPAIVARTGWATDELAAAMDAATLVPPYALVTLLIGVNNQYRGRALDEYRQQFRGLLQRALALAGRDAGRVIVVSIPDWGATPFAVGADHDPVAIAGEIDAFNGVARDEADLAGTRWVDITRISRAPGTRDALAADGLHPSAVQYDRWVDAILPSARAALAGPRGNTGSARNPA